MAAEQLVVGAKAIADVLGLPRRLVYDLVAQGKVPSFRLGQRIVASPTQLHAWRQRRLDEASRRAAS